MVNAIARPFRWRDMLESDWQGRVLRLTLLAPEIMEAILNGRQPAELQLDGLMRRFQVEWREQRAELDRRV